MKIPDSKWTVEETKAHESSREPGLLIGVFGRYCVVDNYRYDNPSSPEDEMERAVLLTQCKEAMEFIHDVWTTLGKDISHNKGFNKQLFHDRAQRFFMEPSTP